MNASLSEPEWRSGNADNDPIVCPAFQATHLLKYDSILGTFDADVKVVDDSTISVDGKNIKIVSSRDPLKLPWGELGIDIVIEVSFMALETPLIPARMLHHPRRMSRKGKVVLSKAEDLCVLECAVRRNH
jgi:hypothetical protein